MCKACRAVLLLSSSHLLYGICLLYRLDRFASCACVRPCATVNAATSLSLSLSLRLLQRVTLMSAVVENSSFRSKFSRWSRFLVQCFTISIFAVLLVQLLNAFVMNPRQSYDSWEEWISILQGSRTLAFPTVDQRVRYYMGDWYDVDVNLNLTSMRSVPFYSVHSSLCPRQHVLQALSA